MHRSVEAAMGLFLVICPVLFGYAPGSPLDVSVQAVFVAGAFGLILATQGLVAPRILAVSLHMVVDCVLAAALVIACIAFALRGDTEATLLFAAVGFPYALMVIGTRYEALSSDRQDEATTVSEEIKNP